MIYLLFKVFFVESLCDDPDVIATNILVYDTLKSLGLSNFIYLQI